MSFFSDLTRFIGSVAPPGKDAAEPEGLDLAIDAIDAVIREIDHQMSMIKPREFATQASIAPVSFGGADSAPNLATHYDRAHEVTWRTLDGLKRDLESFQRACAAAKDQIIRADEQSSEELHRTQSAVEALEAGSQSGYGSQAHQRAQQNPSTSTGDDA